MSTFLEDMLSRNAGQIPNITLGWRLQMALRHAGLSIQQLADDLEVSRNTVSRWINDHGAPPKRVYLLQWAMRTGVDSAWLLTGHAESHRPDGPDDGFSELCAARDSNPEPAGSQLPGTKRVIFLGDRRGRDRQLVAA